jgi:hypothetical protein
MKRSKLIINKSSKAVSAVAALVGSLLISGSVAMPVNASESAVQPIQPKQELAKPMAHHWQDFSTKLLSLGDAVLARAPARFQNNPVMQQQMYRLLLAAMSRTVNDALVADRQHPMFVPELNIALNIYQPNADTVYKSALIDGDGVYRVRGKRGSILYALLGQFGPDMIRTGVGSPPIAYLNFDDLSLDADGRYSVILSQERPEDYQGDWWKLSPKAEKLMLRQVSYNWVAEVDPSIAIERLDTAAARPAASAEDMNQALQELPSMILNAAIFFVDHVESLREKGFLNKLTIFDVSQMAGLEGQSYYEGAYEIEQSEALLIEVKLPKQCRYWSLLLTNDVYQTTDWYNNHSSLNGSQASVDDDGYFRAVISAEDPGVANWLDTAGFASGAIQGRWLECSEAPLPTIKKVAVESLRQHLPKNTPVVSPAQREDIIRQRREALQLRRLW